MAYNDINYLNLVQKTMEDLGEEPLIEDDSDLESISNKLSTYSSNVLVDEIFEYWNRDVYNEGGVIASLALFKATNDIVSASSQSNSYDEECEYDYGIFLTSFEQLDCSAIKMEHGCCAGLYCEVTNCGSRAYIEVASQLGITPNEAAMATVSTLLNSLIRGAKSGIWGVAIYVLAKTIIGAAHVADLLLDLFACSWDMVFHQSTWSSPCKCLCPIKPLCDYDSMGDPMGGFEPLIPENCD